MLIEKLVEKKIISEEQAIELQKELQQDTSGISEEDFLLIKKILSEDELNKLKSEIYDLPLYEYRKFRPNNSY